MTRANPNPFDRQIERVARRALGLSASGAAILLGLTHEEARKALQRIASPGNQPFNA